MKKKITYHFGVKFAAWILLALLIFAFFLSVAGIAVLVNTSTIPVIMNAKGARAASPVCGSVAPIAVPGTPTMGVELLKP
jgi:hypothetical protein